MQHTAAAAAAETRRDVNPRVNVEQKTVLQVTLPLSLSFSQWVGPLRAGRGQLQQVPIDGHKFHLARRRAEQRQHKGKHTEALLTPSTLLLHSEEQEELQEEREGTSRLGNSVGEGQGG